MGIFSKEAEGQEPSAMYDERKKVSKSSSCDDMIDETVRYFTQTDPMLLMSLERGMLSKPEFVASVKKHIATLTNNHEERAAVYKGFASFVWSYDILDDLINDESISDIKVFGKNQIRVKRYGKRETSPVHFRNDAHFNRFIEHVAVKNKVSISDQNALQSFVDKSSNPHFILRFNISTGFVNSTEEPYLHIRKIPKKKYTIQELIAFNMMDEQTAAYLIDRAQNGEGMLFCGKGASGKTTMMNVLIDYIPHDKSGLVIQENEELFSNSHPDLMFQHTVANRGEGKIEYGLSDLARNGLLVDLDYFVIGEIKGGEALYLLNAVYTGHRGWASVHGASSTEALNKLTDYIKYASDYTRNEALQMLTHLSTIVFMKDFRVEEISEVVRWNPQTNDIEYKKILTGGNFCDAEQSLAK